MNAMCETLETRSLMSATMGPTEMVATGPAEPAAIGLLLPAVQKVRDAANRMPTSVTLGDDDVEPAGLLLPAVQKVREAAARLSTGAGTSSGGGHTGGVNVLLMDGSVRSMGDGSVRFIKDSVNM